MKTELGLRERKKLRTRQLIADTARKLFLERGFEHVSVAEIARTADVSEATVFNYFRTKEDLVFSGLEQFEAELLDSIRQREPGEPALAAFARFILAPRGFLAEEDDARAADLTDITRLITSSPGLLAREQQIFAAYTDSLARLLAEETAASTKDIRPQVAASAMIGIHRALINFVRQRLLAGETNPKRLARDWPQSGMQLSRRSATDSAATLGRRGNDGKRRHSGARASRDAIAVPLPNRQSTRARTRLGQLADRRVPGELEVAQ